MRAWRPIMLAFALALLCLLAFAPVLSHGFVNWDDPYNFLQNYAFRGLGLNQIAWAWTSRHLGVYQPLAWLLFEVEYTAFGLSPAGYHATSLALHAIDTVLLFLLLRDSLKVRAKSRHDGKADLAAALLAALFACHPLRVEVVAWISCQPYLLCGGVLLGSAWCYLRSLDDHRRRWAIASFLGFVAAVLCKAAAAFAPVLFVACYLLRSVRPWAWRQVIRKHLPYVAVSLATLFTAVWAREDIHQSPQAATLDFGGRLAHAGYALSLYLVKSVWPQSVSPYYARPDGAMYSLACLLPLAVLIACVMLWRRYPWPLLGLGVAFAAVVPNLGFLQIASVLAADRYTYLATLGVFVVLAASPSTPKLLSLPAVGFLGTCAAILLATAVLSHAQSAVWSDSESLWLDALAKGGEGAEDVHNNLGLAYNEHAKWSLAEREFRRAIEISPRYALAYTNLGITLQKRQQYAEALTAFKAAIDLDPNVPESLTGAAYMSHLLGDDTAAYQYVQRSLQQRVDDATALTLLAQICALTNRLPEAHAAITHALALEPEDPSALNTLGAVLSLSQDWPGAIRAYQAALAQNPSSPEANLNLADALVATGKAAAAAAHYRAVLDAQPSNLRARTGLEKSLSAQ